MESEFGSEVPSQKTCCSPSRLTVSCVVTRFSAVPTAECVVSPKQTVGTSRSFTFCCCCKCVCRWPFLALPLMGVKLRAFKFET